MTVPKKMLALVIVGLSLVGCSKWVKADQPAADEDRVISLQAGETLGQTFVAHEAGLGGIEVFLIPETAGDGEIHLHLRADSEVATDLAVSKLPLVDITHPDFYRFEFTPQADSRQRDYYVLLEIAGPGSVRVGGAHGNAYLDGALYQDNRPVDAQMTFRLAYASREALEGLAREVLTWAEVLGAGVLLYILPGWALLVVLWPSSNSLAWPEKLGLAIGLSLAIYPILFLWTDLIRIHLGALYAWLPSLGALAMLLWRMRRWRPAILRTALMEWLRSEHLWPDVALLIVMGLVLGVRFWVIRTLDVPMWGDSYQHTMIAQLLVDHGGLFDTWQPYADLQSFTYHFGFHAAVAAFHWTTGLTLPRATLWTGQILNGLAVLALYPLAMRLGGNRWAGVGAVLLGGLLSPMPMFYVNWGRYTQLAGQAILPGAVCLAWLALEARPINWRLIILSGVAFGGLALTHYRILLMAAFFFAAFFLLEARPGRLRALFVKMFWLGSVAGLLFLPWFIHISAGKTGALATTLLTIPASSTADWIRQSDAIVNLPFFLPIWVWLGWPLVIGWGLWRRQKGVAILSLWWLLVMLGANPQWLRLPGEWVIGNFTLFIAAYIPAGILIGAAIGLGIETLKRRRGMGLALLLLVIGAGMWGARQRIGDLQVTSSALVTRPDVRAAAWIQNNTVPSARFLVNSFLVYGGGAIVGSDAGWWLPLLAGRSNTVPPLNYGLERGPRHDFQAWINIPTAEIQAKGLTHPDVLALLREHGVTHVYIGQRQGRVNYSGPTLDPAQLLSDAHFRVVYHQDRVWIFEVCGAVTGCEGGVR